MISDISRKKSNLSSNKAESQNDEEELLQISDRPPELSPKTEEEAKDLLVRFDENSNEIQEAIDSTKNPADLLDSIIRVLSLRVTAEQLQQLFNFYKTEIGQDPHKASSLPELRRVFGMWYVVAAPVLLDHALERMILDTIHEYNTCLQTCSNEEKEVLQDLLVELRQQLNKLCPQKVSAKAKFKQQERGLLEIFRFYASQSTSLSQSQSYEDFSTEEDTTINLSKFQIFLRDFGIYGLKHAKNQKQILKIEAIDIFKANSNPSTKSMDETQFFQCLDGIAQVYFDEEYDELKGTDMAERELDEKRQEFYHFLGCENAQIYKPKLKGVVQPFSKREPGTIFTSTGDKSFSRQITESVIASKIMKHVQGSKRAEPGPLASVIGKHLQPTPSEQEEMDETFGEAPSKTEEEPDLSFLVASESSSEDEEMEKSFAALGIQRTRSRNTNH